MAVKPAIVPKLWLPSIAKIVANKMFLQAYRSYQQPESKHSWKVGQTKKFFTSFRHGAMGRSEMMEVKLADGLE